MMIGKQIQQPVQSWNEYTKTVLWCNDNKAMIEDKCDWYEVVALPEETLDEAGAAKLAELNTAFPPVSETAHCMSSAGFEINADEIANRNIEGLVLVLNEGESTLFRDWDNRFHEVKKEQLETMRKEIVVAIHSGCIRPNGRLKLVSRQRKQWTNWMRSTSCLKRLHRLKEKAMGRRFSQIPIAFDQLVNTLFGGWADETISSAAWRKRRRQWLAVFACVI